MNNLREEDNSYQSDQDSLNSSDKEGPISDTKNRMIKEEEGQPEPENTTICVRVKTMDEQEKRFQMSLEDKISDLKMKILDDLEIPIERQRLIYMGKQLKDNLTLLECKLKDDSCILLVANRAQNRSEPPRRAPENQEQSSQNDGEFGAFLLNALNESAQMRRNRRLLFQQNASSFLRNIRLNINESREAITQNIASTQLLLDTRTEVEELKTLQPDVSNSMDCFDFEKRHLKVGQWVDVKDTINQWLEAQVVEIRDNRAYVHYNGWGTRWDEWIQIDSPRIALFRTHTIQAATSQYLSP